ncbi:hypothetical protein [Pseudosulfitobacter sp. DSM 107133]|uniref:hypothetical protein n=1 Tax=Pseudosulfitobacter sp. DSM 107133 TaxID=2883100 RepID=UPI0013B3E251|nr:hypothetical protein [Pseudosulfitobacter sp. DSM 107133]
MRRTDQAAGFAIDSKIAATNPPKLQCHIAQRLVLKLPFALTELSILPLLHHPAGR